MPVVLSLNPRFSSSSFGSPSSNVLSSALRVAQSTAVVAVMAPVHDRIAVMFAILAASFIAVSFPAVSSSGIVRVPNMLFFVGKHFGTGVILATAFIHLLPDSFSTLLDPEVEKEYGNVGKWVGLIILGSLLTIFLVEYVSTTFVDRLQADPSAPPTPQLANAPVPLPITASPHLLPEPAALMPFLANTPKLLRMRSSNVACICQNGVCVCLPETAVPGSPSHSLSEAGTLSRSSSNPHVHGNVHAHEHRQKRIGRRRQIVGIFVLQVGIMVHSLVIGLTLSITSGADFASLTTAIIFHQIFEGLSLGVRIAALPHSNPTPSSEDGAEPPDLEESETGERHGVPSAPSISELEGLSSIQPATASSVSSSSSAPPETPANNEQAETDALLKRTASTSSGPVEAHIDGLPAQRRSRPTILKLDWTGWTPHLHRSTSQKSLNSQDRHQSHYGSTSDSHQERFPTSTSAERPASKRKGAAGRWRFPSCSPLKVTLSVLFAITTPTGMALGLAVWDGAAIEGGAERVSMKLTQGIMSAVSAGMLIYAATVEMIAGDFVFGNLEGHHHHGPGGEHQPEHQPGEAHSDHPSIGKRVTAVLSLLLGVVAMAVIGLGEPEGH
ncbi:hypothetical protein D9611_006868 [Ephemerocybe angulata]|uniref:Zinc/iron permease n=1 Tax=Ephemerocybe angulata TaxID=980116 RepID=A0A8H5EVM3_9AGAR|nr:hypothetical protein D9611_006868 [Tulosesus angulatus]